MCRLSVVEDCLSEGSRDPLSNPLYPSGGILRGEDDFERPNGFEGEYGDTQASEDEAGESDLDESELDQHQASRNDKSSDVPMPISRARRGNTCGPPLDIVEEVRDTLLSVHHHFHQLYRRMQQDHKWQLSHGCYVEARIYDAMKDKTNVGSQKQAPALGYLTSTIRK